MTIQSYLQSLQDYVVEYIDINYSLWLTWCLAPLLISFLLPVVIALLLYLTAFILYIYKLHWRNIRITLQIGDKWEAARKTAAAVWDAHGWIWHGYEIRGLENIPETGPALIIYYHGAIPIDIYYFLAKTLFLKNRLVHTVADYFLFKIPGFNRGVNHSQKSVQFNSNTKTIPNGYPLGFNIIADCMKVIPGTIQSCSNILKEGNLLAISPGGVYEAQFSHHYNLMWKRRLGFAKVALDAKVPIIPMFTENLREAFRTLSIGRRMFLRLYALFKFPFAPIYGGFPVKMISHVGKPIAYDPSLTPEDLQAKVAAALNDLIRRNQRIPGNILLGILDRIPYFKAKNSLQHEE